MSESAEQLRRAVAQALRDGGPKEVAELLYQTAREYSGNDAESCTVACLENGVHAAAEQAVKAYGAGRVHLCDGEALRHTSESACSLCTGDWASGREERAAEEARRDCVNCLQELARSHRDLAASQDEADAAEQEAALAQVLEAAAFAITSRARPRVPHCPSCSEALMLDGEQAVVGTQQCVFCGSKIEVGKDGACRIIFDP